ncbi:MAG TPA: Crp/Fnr family transcriptional regulator [Tenuifilum sp.]|uniref:Crp/Fnr family transcriptional regulator n=1 Tax=Tenuifilum sp. TaxID=2760880 RepID=UPI002C86D13E|nr:Crp/Fnr family transcriptional regulator [Tenuifilum sp.]HOK85167.1 Crp/Fnr family transcriptional regulator [Tenuifilum sp.]
MADVITISFEKTFEKCKLPVNQLLTAEQQAIIMNSINIVNYNRKDIIVKQYSASSHVYYIIKGIIKVSSEQRKGKNLVMKIDTTGSFVGLISLLGGDSYDFTVTAVENCTLAQIPITTLKSVMLQNARFALEISQLISRHGLFLINRLAGLLYKQLPGRVADLILYFADDIFCNNEFEFPVNRTELAELCGTTKESLIRTLSEFNHDRIIELERNRIRIISYDILKTLSRFG